MNTEKTSLRKEKSAETKRKIYEAAFKLFKQHGFDNVSVDTIVETAGVSKGAFYVYFASKSSLIAALSVDAVKDADMDYKSYIGSLYSDKSASDMVVLLAVKIAEVLSLNLGYDLMKCTYEAYLTRSVNLDALLTYNRDLYQTFKDLIIRGIELDEFKKELDIDTVTNHCVMSLRGLTYEWCIRHPDFDLLKEVKIHFELLLSGMKK